MPARIAIITLSLALMMGIHAEGAKRLSSQSGKFDTRSADERMIQPITVEAEQENVSQVATDVTIDEYSNWQLLSGGGILNGRSADYIHSGALTQTAIGSGLSANLVVNHGFWQTPPNSSNGCCSMAGDANNDGQANVGDAVFIVSYVFKGGAPPNCMLESDANGDCEVNVADAVYMVGYCFKDGHMPVCGCSR